MWVSLKLSLNFRVSLQLSSSIFETAWSRWAFSGDIGASLKLSQPSAEEVFSRSDHAFTQPSVGPACCFEFGGLLNWRPDRSNRVPGWARSQAKKIMTLLDPVQQSYHKAQQAMANDPDL
jgi:hypothetical protein